MKILIFSWRDIKNPKSGGAEIFTHEAAKRWLRAGHPVTIVTARFPRSKPEETIEGIKVFRPAELFHLTPFSYLSYLRKTAQFYKKNLKGRFDLVIDQVHGLPLFCKFYVEEQIVAFAHEVAREIWFYEIPFPFCLIGYLAEPLYFKLYQNVPFIANSPSTAKDLKRMGIKKISIISQAFAFQPVKSVPKKANYPLIIFLGRLTRMKRIEETIKAFRIIASTFPKAKLLIVGRGEESYLKKLKMFCHKLEIEEKLKFIGFKTGREKTKVLKKAWVLVVTSVREGWGIVVTEAAACGTPTVAYKVPGLVDSVEHGKTGILCPKNTPQELAKNLSHLISNDHLRKQLSKNALEHSRQFSFEKSAKEQLTILKRIISQ